jgi:hypothetical protein
MIHIPGHSLFVHIPKTSGMSLSVLAQRNRYGWEDGAPNIVLGEMSQCMRRHSTALELRNEIPEFFSIQKWTIIRNPWRIFESAYRFFCGRAEAMRAGHSRWKGTAFQREVETLLADEFPGFVQTAYGYMTQGGFFSHWCTDWNGADWGIEVLKYEQLDWPRICDLLMVPHNAPRPLYNASEPQRCEWTKEAIDIVRCRCWDDFSRFGYDDVP